MKGLLLQVNLPQGSDTEDALYLLQCSLFLVLSNLAIIEVKSFDIVKSFHIHLQQISTSLTKMFHYLIASRHIYSPWTEKQTTLKDRI